MYIKKTVIIPNNFMIKKLKQKIPYYLFMIMWIISILPFVILSFYNHPSADDYSYSDLTHQVWLQTNSLIKVMIQAVKDSIHNWNTWQGLYSSSTLLSLQPALFGEKLYCLSGLIMLCIIVVMNLGFAIYIFSKKLHLKKEHSLLLSMLISFIMIQWMPDVNEGLYWFNGAVNYGVFYAVYIAFLCGLISILTYTHKKYPIWKLIVIEIVGLFLEGGNHVTAFLGMEIGAAAVIVSIFLHNKMKIRNCITVFAFATCGFLLNITSPGTKVRQLAIASEKEFTYGPVRSVYLSVTCGIEQISEWITSDLLIFLLLVSPILLYIAYIIIEKIKYQFNYPIVILIISFAFHCSMLCPPIYAMGSTGAGRLNDIVFYNFVINLIFNMLYLFCYFLKNIDVEQNIHSVFDNKKLRYSLIGLEMIILIFWGVEFGSNLNVCGAIDVLRSGDAKTYSQECVARDETLKISEEKEATVPAYTITPKYIFRTDIEEDVSNWKNIGVARYYGLKSIKLEE